MFLYIFFYIFVYIFLGFENYAEVVNELYLFYNNYYYYLGTRSLLLLAE